VLLGTIPSKSAARTFFRTLHLKTEEPILYAVLQDEYGDTVDGHQQQP
jgi:hypothetical protein